MGEEHMVQIQVPRVKLGNQGLEVHPIFIPLVPLLILFTSSRFFNKRTMVVEESIHVIFYESNNSLQERESFDYLGLETSMGKLQIEDRRPQEEIVENPKKEESPLTLPPPQQVQGESSQNLPKDWKFVINHPQDQIIYNPSSGVRTRSSLNNICNSLAFISQIEPTNINDALDDENWMIVMQEKLNQFERSEV